MPDSAVAEGSQTIDVCSNASTSVQTVLPGCTMTFTVIAKGGIIQLTFGWYIATGTKPAATDLHPLLGPSNNLDGQVAVLDTAYVTACPTKDCPIGFYLISKGQGTFYSDPAWNPCPAHFQMLSWQSVAHPNTFYLGWEDQACTGDGNFYDLLLRVENQPCPAGGAGGTGGVAGTAGSGVGGSSLGGSSSGGSPMSGGIGGTVFSGGVGGGAPSGGGVNVAGTSGVSGANFAGTGAQTSSGAATGMGGTVGTGGIMAGAATSGAAGSGAASANEKSSCGCRVFGSRSPPWGALLSTLGVFAARCVRRRRSPVFR
jgi:hypothetical protein